MIVKRVSYFTFIVAITTLASVTACSQAKAMAGHVADNSDPVFEHIEKTAVCTTELQRILQDKGLVAGSFKITQGSSDQKDAVKIYLVINKDYKGQVSAKIFKEKSKEYSYQPTKPEIAEAVVYLTSAFNPDKSTGIASKNLILLE